MKEVMRGRISLAVPLDIETMYHANQKEWAIRIREYLLTLASPTPGNPTSTHPKFADDLEAKRKARKIDQHVKLFLGALDRYASGKVAYLNPARLQRAWLDKLGVDWRELMVIKGFGQYRDVMAEDTQAEQVDGGR